MKSRHDAILGPHRFQRGDEAAFVEIVNAPPGENDSKSPWGILRDHSDAEEIAQDTFLCAPTGDSPSFAATPRWPPGSITSP
jgi:hypothetical protein